MTSVDLTSRFKTVECGLVINCVRILLNSRTGGKARYDSIDISRLLRGNFLESFSQLIGVAHIAFDHISTLKEGSIHEFSLITFNLLLVAYKCNCFVSLSDGLADRGLSNVSTCTGNHSDLLSVATTSSSSSELVQDVLECVHAEGR